jgi:hypothetical protein
VPRKEKFNEKPKGLPRHEVSRFLEAMRIHAPRVFFLIIQLILLFPAETLMGLEAMLKLFDYAGEAGLLRDASNEREYWIELMLDSLGEGEGLNFRTGLEITLSFLDGSRPYALNRYAHPDVIAELNRYGMLEAFTEIKNTLEIEGHAAAVEQFQAYFDQLPQDVQDALRGGALLPGVEDLLVDLDAKAERWHQTWLTYFYQIQELKRFQREHPGELQAAAGAMAMLVILFYGYKFAKARRTQTEDASMIIDSGAEAQVSFDRPRLADKLPEGEAEVDGTTGRIVNSSNR